MAQVTEHTDHGIPTFDVVGTLSGPETAILRERIDAAIQQGTMHFFIILSRCDNFTDDLIVVSEFESISELVNHAGGWARLIDPTQLVSRKLAWHEINEKLEIFRSTFQALLATEP